jgi:DNA-directed RNA polymerase beta' subunit
MKKLKNLNPSFFFCSKKRKQKQCLLQNVINRKNYFCFPTQNFLLYPRSKFLYSKQLVPFKLLSVNLQSKFKFLSFSPLKSIGVFTPTEVKFSKSSLTFAHIIGAKNLLRKASPFLELSPEASILSGLGFLSGAGAPLRFLSGVSLKNKSQNRGLSGALLRAPLRSPLKRYFSKGQTTLEGQKKYDTAYSKLSEVKLITIGLASPEKIRQWAEKTLPNGKVLGQVTNANTLHHKTFKPQKGGLFCERIFGPLKDFQCACGTIVSKPLIEPYSMNLRRIEDPSGPLIEASAGLNSKNEEGLKNEKNSSQEKFLISKEQNKNQIPTLQGPKAQSSRRFCKKCDVEYTWSVIRRYQLGYIELVSPVTHLWYLKGSPSYLSILLDMKKRHIEYVTYCTESLTLENSIKGINQNRFNKIPSQMLLNWENTVRNVPQVGSQSKFNLVYGTSNKTSRSVDIEIERKKQKRLKTHVQKRLLPLALLNSVNSSPEVTSLKDLIEAGGLNSKKSEAFLLFLGHSPKNQSVIWQSQITLQKLFLLQSLIHKIIYESLSFDILNDSNKSLFWRHSPQNRSGAISGAPAPLEFWQSQNTDPLKNQIKKESFLNGTNKMISVKKLLKKLPTSLYLFLNLQLCFQKQFFIVTKNKFWKAIYLNSLKRSIKNIFFLYESIFWNKNLGKLSLLKNKKGHSNYSYDSSVYKQEPLQSKNNSGGTSLKMPLGQNFAQKHKEILLFIEMVKNKWFYSFLNFLKQLSSQNLFELNKRLFTSYEERIQQNIDFLSEEFFVSFNRSFLKNPNRSQNLETAHWFLIFPLIGSNSKTNRNANMPSLVSLIAKAKKYNETLLHAFFTILIKEKIHHSSFGEPQSAFTPSNLFFLAKLNLSVIWQSQNRGHSPQNSKENTSIKNQNLNQNLLDVSALESHLWQEQNLGLNLDLKNKKVFLTKIKKQYLLLIKFMDLNRSIHSKNLETKESFNPNFSTKAPLATEYLCNLILLFSLSGGSATLTTKSKSLHRKHLGSYLLGSVLKMEKESYLKKQNLTTKSPKLFNQIYTLSHRERWIDEEWQNFIDYMSVPSLQTSLLNEQNKQKSINFNSQLTSKTTSSYSEGTFPDKVQEIKAPFVSEIVKEYNLIPAYQNRIFNLNIDQFFSHSGGLTLRKVPQFWLSGAGAPLRFLQSQNKSLNISGAPAPLKTLSRSKASINLRQKNNSWSNLVGNNHAFFSGPGIIQQLLNEFDFSELQKIDKQNRILLYQLNKHIFLLKKRISKSARKELKECYKKRDQLIRRTKLIRTFFRKDSKPNSMILTILPVLPPDLRPIVKIGGQVAASDLNRLYQRVIYRNDRLKKFLKEPATSSSYEMKYAQRLLQEAVDNLIQNGKSGTASEKDARGRALKSLSDLLKGKQGRFRQYLLGKRVDYSGRSVIVVGPKLQLHECGLPKEMALELYFPFLLKRLINHNYARTVVGAKTLMKKDPDLTWELLKEIMQTCPILLNRAPTLHRLGIQAFQPKLIEGRAILLHPLVCPAFNADFDGDQMAVHVPITIEARAEAWKLMCARQNFLSPATGEPLAIPSQDMVLGCYYLTTHCNKSSIKNQKGSGFSFSDFSDVLNAYRRQIIDLHALVWVKFDGHLEQENQLESTIELRINSYGNWNEIYQFIQKNYSKKQNLVNQYICTTPGRILFNFIVQKTLFGFSKNLN